MTGPPRFFQTAPAIIGRSLEALLGNDEFMDFNSLSFSSPPYSYDSYLRTYAFNTGRFFSSSPITSTPWTERALPEILSLTESTIAVTSPITYETFGVATREAAVVTHSNLKPKPKARKYKPAHMKHRPVPTNFPDPVAQQFKPIPPPIPTTMPSQPQKFSSLKFGRRVTRERFEDMMKKMEPGILRPKELDLLAYVVVKREAAFAWEQSERGSFSREYYPDYEIPTIEHTPWQTKPIRISDSLIADVREEIRKGEAAGKFEPMTSSYRSPLFAVKKKSGVRLVINLEELNSVTIQDSALPPNINDFAADYIGYVMYGLADLFSGFNARWASIRSRPMFAFTSPSGPRQQATLVQGYTNSIPEFQRCADHALHSVSHIASAFIDDCGVKGPTTRYGDVEIHPGIHQFVWEYVHNPDLVLGALINAGITASGAKAILAAEHLKIVGSIVCLDGWIIEPSLVSKIINYPQPQSVTEVRGFLGVSGVGRRWIERYALIAKPMTILLRDIAEKDFLFTLEAVEAFEELKHLVSTAPVIITIDYAAAKLIVRQPRASDEGLVIVGVDGSWIGAGWAVYQIRDSKKRPAGFGSCTFSDREQNYGQPKTELYAVFRAFKELRHRIWGIHFRLDHDAISLAMMIREPDDVPNAPILRWVS